MQTTVVEMSELAWVSVATPRLIWDCAGLARLQLVSRSFHGSDPSRPPDVTMTGWALSSD